jgi:hypothetical protein
LGRNSFKFPILVFFFNLLFLPASLLDGPVTKGDKRRSFRFGEKRKKFFPTAVLGTVLFCTSKNTELLSSDERLHLQFFSRSTHGVADCLSGHWNSSVSPMDTLCMDDLGAEIKKIITIY